MLGLRIHLIACAALAALGTLIRTITYYER
jgi:hypothetical protein